MNPAPLLFLIIICLAHFNCSTAQKKSTDSSSVYTYDVKTRDGIGKYYLGREIAHMMGAGGIEWLNRVERDKEENSSLAIEKMNLPADAVVADIGAGSGYYSFRIADAVPNGKVYAVEVQDEMILHLNEQKVLQKKNNVMIVKGDSMNVLLPEHSVDLAIMVDVYHELEYPHEMLQSIKRALKPGGRLLLIEYRGEDPSVPIKPLHKMTEKQVNREMEINGFKLSEKGDFLPLQHFLLYTVKN